MGFPERNLKELQDREFDLIVVGGGIFGAAAAWDGALCGLTVALIDKGDFCGGTSANHFKMVHGGIRYLQHGDLVRIRESCKERSALLRIAPHLVRPLPILVPTYGHGLKGKAFLSTGMLLYDLLTLDRNRRLLEERKIPRGKTVSREQVVALFPDIKRKGLTGGIVFFDAQMYNPPRLVLAFLRSAAEKGAVAANYCKVTGILSRKSRVVGVKAHDLVGNMEIEIRGRCVLNAAGPWAVPLLESTLRIKIEPRPCFSRDLALVIKRNSSHEVGLAISTRSRDADAILDRGGRHLFMVPWRTYTLIGVWHYLFNGIPEDIVVGREELADFLREAGEAYPGLRSISLDDITMVNTGLTLFGRGSDQKENRISFGKRSLLIDHASSDHLEGLVTLIGVRATTARGMARKAIGLILKKLGRDQSVSATEDIPLFGGSFASFEELLNQVVQRCGPNIDPVTAGSIAHNYGCEYPRILKYIEEDNRLSERVEDSHVLKAEIVHGVREEMALKLSDVIFRRTDLGTGICPTYEQIQQCADVMASEMGWEQEKSQQEMSEVLSSLSNSVYKGAGSRDGCSY